MSKKEKDKIEVNVVNLVEVTEVPELDDTEIDDEHRSIIESTKVDNTPRDIAEVADDVYKGVDILDTINQSTSDNMKAFLLVYAKSQLNRVVKLTNKLSELEDKLIDESLNSDNISLKDLTNITRIIQKSLSSALGFIQQVTTDETYLSVVINNSEIINNTLNADINNSPLINSQKSRDNIRLAVNEILAKVNTMSSNIAEVKDAEIIDEVKVK